LLLFQADQKGTLEAQLAELSHHLGRLKYLGASAAFFSAVALPHHHIGDPNSPIQYARWAGDLEHLQQQQVLHASLATLTLSTLSKEQPLQHLCSNVGCFWPTKVSLFGSCDE